MQVWTPAQPLAGSPLPSYTDPSRPIQVKVGQEFTLLTMGDFAGDTLQVEAAPTDETIVRGEGWVWSPEAAAAPWTYRAIGPGATQVRIVRSTSPDPEEAAPEKQPTFNVTAQ